jgi:hypothetical protein
MCQTWHSAITIEIGSNAHMLYTHDTHGMVDVPDSMNYGGIAILTEKTLVEGNLHHSPDLGKTTHLFVAEIAGMIA